MLNFVNLYWRFIEKGEYPVEDGNYLCLIIGEDGKPKVLEKIYMFDEEIGIAPSWFSGNHEIYTGKVVAWSDPTKVTFECDPSKAVDCRQTGCKQFCGPCHQTTHYDWAKRD